MPESTGKTDDGFTARLDLGVLDFASEGIRRVLILGSERSDAANVERRLRNQCYDVRAIVVTDEEALIDAVGSFAPDVVLTDSDLAHLSSEQVIGTLTRLFPSLPVIVLTGTLDDDDAARLLGLGARDYVLKDRPARLGFAVQSAISAARDREEACVLEAERARFAEAMERSQTGSATSSSTQAISSCSWTNMGSSSMSAPQSDRSWATTRTPSWGLWHSIRCTPMI